MRALVVYEPIFSNTRDIAAAIAAGLRGRGASVDLFEVNCAPTSNEGYDLIVVGAPIHAWNRAPSDQSTTNAPTGVGVREWLRGLAPNIEVEATALDTATKTKWLAVGSATNGETQGHQLIAAPQHFFVESVHGPLIPGEQERAKEWGSMLSELYGETIDKPLPRKKSRWFYAAGLIANLAVLWVANQHLVWRPWLDGIVTRRWVDVLWVVNLSISIRIIADTLLFLWSPRWLTPLTELANSLAGVVSVIVFYDVYPFDFSLAIDWFDPVLRFTLVFALVGVAIASIVSLTRLLFAFFDKTPQAQHPNRSEALA